MLLSCSRRLSPCTCATYLHSLSLGGTTTTIRYVCNELGECGSTAYIANRGCEMETRHLRLMFDLGNAVS